MSTNYPNEQPLPNAPGTSSGYQPVSGAAGTPFPGSGTPPPNYPGPQYAPGPAAPLPGAPNPALAAVLGFIPGVGAMYNGQFAKGIAHIAIFAVFSTLSEHTGGSIFGLLVAGWIFYMVFEAYQTARARRNGWPLPDPFGLNNIGDRFGFRSNPDFSSFWAAPPAGTVPPVSETSHVDPVTGAVHYARTDATGAQASYHVDPSGHVYASANPPETFAPAGGTGYVPPQPGSPGYVPNPAPSASAYSGAGYYNGPPYGAAAPETYGVPPFIPPASRGSSVPVGAFWLIGLGFLALLGTLRPFRFLQGEATGGLFLIGISILLFIRSGLHNTFFTSGSRSARWYVARSVRGAGIVFIIGLLTLLQGLHIIYWSSSWPFLLIFLGVILLVERLAANNVNGIPYPVAAHPAPSPADPPHETASPTSIMPKGTSRPIVTEQTGTSDQGGH